MKKTIKTGIPFILSLLGLSFLAYAGPKDAEGMTISIAGDTYKIPEEYNACCTSEPDKYGNHNLVIQFAKTNMGPLLENPPGWETNVNLLLSDSKFPVYKIYDMQWDGKAYPETST